MLEPTTFPIAISGKPSKAELILTMSSGAEVAKDTTVNPMTALDKPNFNDKPTADFKSQLPPIINKKSPEIINKIFININNLHEDSIRFLMSGTLINLNVNTIKKLIKYFLNSS